MGKTFDFFARRAANQAIKPITKGDKIQDPKTIEKHSAMMIKMLGINPVFTEQKARGILLKNSSLPKDIRKLRKKTGWSDEQIIEHYWQVDKFRELWVDMLKMDRNNFEFLVVTMSRNKDWAELDLTKAKGAIQ